MYKLPSRFRFKVKPWKHQAEGLKRSWRAEAFALLMEQGTGKTKVVVDTAAMLYSEGLIDGVLVFGPNGVQRAWINDALPEHMSPDVPYVGAYWRNKRTKKLQAANDALYNEHFKGLRVLAVNYETLITKAGFAATLKFARSFRILLVADESHKLKNPKAKAAAKAHKLADHADFRRILTGTPVGKGPFDIWSQFLILDKGILKTPDFVAFKAEYAELENSREGLGRVVFQRLFMQGKGKGMTDIAAAQLAAKKMPTMVKRDDCTGQPMYKNLDRLNVLIDPYSYRVLKADCLDLPPKVYERRYITLSPEQRRIYSQLAEDFMAEYEGELMTATLKITLMTRLQQVTGGFFKKDVDTPEVAIGKTNPKLVDLLDVIEQTQGKMLIWARFKPELAMIHDALGKTYGAHSTVGYWGSDKQRDEKKKRFMLEPGCRFFVAQQHAGGTGLDGLQVAKTIAYYSNDFSLIARLQSEDRGHRGGSEIHDKVTIFDFCAEDTNDLKIIDTLRANKDVADAIVGDDPRNWI